ncbi:MAG: hypothetical protein ACFE8A_13050 [Candidatus Hodarchaeota archaeon]
MLRWEAINISNIFGKMICPHYPEKVHSHSDGMCPYRALCSEEEALYNLYGDEWTMPRCKKIDYYINKTKSQASVS